MDVFSPAKRSAVMSRIRGKNTKPEMVVRKLAHALGYRFRLHRRDLPGVPDLVFPRLKKVVFVHGCFWHQHSGCRYAYRPKSHVEFWQKKFLTNVTRDRVARADLTKLGWQVNVIWECQTLDLRRLERRLTAFLEKEKRKGAHGSKHKRVS